MNHLEFLKSKIGATVYLQPTGNNIRFKSSKRVCVIESVSKVFVEITFEGFSQSQKFRISVHGDGRTHISEDGNSGYYVYPDEKSLHDRLYLESLSTNLIRLRKEDWVKFDADLMRQVAFLLKIDVDVTPHEF